MAIPKLAIIKAWSERLGIHPFAGEDLVYLADQAAKAQEVEHNTGRSAKWATDKFDREATKLGLGVDWSPGLFPVLIKDGIRYDLPD